MGSGSKKSKAIDMGNYVAKDREQAAYAWCIHNNIFIAPKAKSTTEWYICITLKYKSLHLNHIESSIKGFKS